MKLRTPEEVAEDFVAREDVTHGQYDVGLVRARDEEIAKACEAEIAKPLEVKDREGEYTLGRIHFAMELIAALRGQGEGK